MINCQFLLLMLSIRSGLGLVGYDCLHKHTEVKTIALHHVSSCSFLSDGLSTETVYAQVLTPRMFSPLSVVSCKITRSSLLTYCGMHSHASIMPEGLSVNEQIRISPSDCRTLHKDLSYTTATGFLIDSIKPNSITTKRFTDVGFVNSDGSCSGVTFSMNGITYKNTIRTSEYKIQLWESNARVNLETKMVTMADGLSCKYSIGGCSGDVSGTHSWEIDDSTNQCGSKHYNVIFEGLANITESKMSPKALLVETPDQHFALALTRKANICNQEGYLTETKDLVVAIGTRGLMPLHNKIDDAKDLNTFMDMNLKFIYVERNIANRTTDLYNLFARRYCELNKQQLTHLLSLARTNPEEFAWVYTATEGYTAITRGEAVQLIRCVPVHVTPRPLNTCYNELPVWYKNESYFLKPSSRNLIRVGTQLSCDSPLSTLFYIDGTWMKIGGSLQVVPDPVQLSASFNHTWSYGAIKSLGQIGYMTEDQISLYRNSIIGPMERDAIADTMVSRIVSHGYSSDQGLDFNAILNKDTLTTSVTDAVINKLYGVWDFMIKHLGAVLGFALLWDLFWGIISCMLNGWMLFRKFGLSGMLLAACWSTCAKHALYGDLATKRFTFRKKKAHPTTDYVAIELGDINTDTKPVSQPQSIYPSVTLEQEKSEYINSIKNML